MKRLLISLALCLSAFASFAQTRTITGKVTGDSESLAGAMIQNKTNGKYAVADNDGKFSLQCSEGDVLSVSFFGFTTAETTVGKSSVCNIDLGASTSTMLDETVVIGYGSTTKKEVTGSVASLKSDNFDVGTYTDAAGLMQGKVAGLSVTNPSGGNPNGSYEIILRGTNTLSAGQGPLIIIDGVVGADMGDINFQEVESIDVLKDGSAAAIYGTRGTNGVIIITTKRASSGKTSVEYEGQVSVQSVLSRATPMNAQQFKDVIEKYKPSALNNLYGAETDWFDEITRTPFSHKHNVAISGGSEKFSHRTILNVEQNQGLMKNNDVQKYLVKTNIHQIAVDGWLTFDYNALYAKKKSSEARTDVFRQAFFHNPTEPVYDETDKENGGYFTIGGMDYKNPVAMLNERSSTIESDRAAVNGRVSLNIKPVKGLKWDNFVSYEVGRYDTGDYKTKYYPGDTGLHGAAEITNNYSSDFQYESTVQYQNTFGGKHNIQAVLGYTYQQKQSKYSYMYNYGFDTDFFGPNNIGAGSAIKEGKSEMTSEKQSSRYIAFFGRAMYNYAEKYLVSVSLRRDGSSRFGSNNKWGWFPAVSLGWRLKEEPWLKSVRWMDDLKLRAGYGVTGNQDFSNYKSLFLIKTDGAFYYNGKWSNAYAPASNANPDLAWERKSEFNVGVDFGFFGGRLSGAIDYYYRYTSNLLYNYSVPVPPYDYKELFTNVGAISNQGIELTLNATPVIAGDFKWLTTLTMSHNTNKLEKFTNEEFKGTEYRTGWLNSPIEQFSQRLIEGQSIGSFYGPRYDSITPIGTMKVVPIDQARWSCLGTAYPILGMGWSNSLKWKDLTVAFTLRASIGGKVYNQMRTIYENITELGQKNILASWLNNTQFTGDITYCDLYLEDASYLKMDNLSLAYDFHFDNRIIHGVNVYFTAQNVFTVTGYSGVDPEVGLGGLTPGIEGLSYYPRTRVFTLGVKLKF